ncbi:DUF6371 domain-containing protein [Polaribacter glomeratus]|nr:DUF6371 domain-containing protein [Polaribacter glomeratus]TXD64924.1 hypothetical protein ESX12_12325 [Polaribacter glomeratus]
MIYKYSLHRKSIKHICPRCAKKRFVRYVDNESNQYLSDKVGRCDREQNCGHHYTPKFFFNDNQEEYKPILSNTAPWNSIQQDASFHKNEELATSLCNYDKNNFVKFLKSKFDINKVNEMMQQYKIGTQSNKFYGTIFWQIDFLNKVKGGKIINYDNLGKRTKYINWVHAVNIKQKKIRNFNLEQCLFGLHLMKSSSKTIAIVESEKTACVMTMLFDKYLWMATGSLGGLNQKKIAPLKNRTIILYPDLGESINNHTPYSKWKKKCDEFKKKGFNIKISDLLEQNSTYNDRKKGLDISDYFIENLNTKPTKIIANNNKKILNMYKKNRKIKTLIDVFDLTNINGNTITF